MVRIPSTHLWPVPKLLSLPQGVHTLKALGSRFRGHGELGDFKCDSPMTQGNRILIHTFVIPALSRDPRTSMRSDRGRR